MEETEKNSKSKAKEWIISSQTVVAMIIVQLIATGLQLLSKIILNNGIFVFALVAYRHIIAAICVIPFALYYERGVKEKLSWSLLPWLFLSGLVGITGATGFFYYGLKYTTMAYAVTFYNLIPVVTFIISLILRIEKMGLDTRGGQMKVFGVIVCLGGVLTCGLYKGKMFSIGHHHVQEAHIHKIPPHANFLLGSCMLVGMSLCIAFWFILQVKVYKLLPLKYWTATFTCIMACIQASILGLIIDRSKESWKLGWNLQLVTILYSGALSTSASYCLITWTISKQGPTYPAMFNPLSLVFTVNLEALMLGTSIALGMIIGMILLIIGSYSFLIGKKKEMKKLGVTRIENEKVITLAIDSEMTEPTGVQNSQNSSVPRQNY